MSKVFSNPGNKLKMIAIVMFLIVFIAGCVGFYFLSLETVYNGRWYVEEVNAFILIVGIITSAIVSYVTSIGLYAFGELVECSTQTLVVQNEILNLLHKTSSYKEMSAPSESVPQ